MHNRCLPVIRGSAGSVHRASLIALAVVLLFASIGCNPDGSEATRDDGVDLPLATIIAMGESGDGTHVTQLLELIQDDSSDPQARMEAIYALARIGDKRAVAPLMAVLERDMKDRKGYAMAAIPALGMLGDRLAVPLLRRALNNRDEFWLGREMAARALGEIGASDAVPDLVQAAWQADTRDAAIVALARIADPRGVDVLFSALVEEQEDDTSDHALRGLAAIGPPTVAFIRSQADRGFADYPDEAYRDAARRVLLQIDSDEARALLPAVAATAN